MTPSNQRVRRSKRNATRARGVAYVESEISTPPTDNETIDLTGADSPSPVRISSDDDDDLTFYTGVSEFPSKIEDPSEPMEKKRRISSSLAGKNFESWTEHGGALMALASQLDICFVFEDVKSLRFEKKDSKLSLSFKIDTDNIDVIIVNGQATSMERWDKADAAQFIAAVKGKCYDLFSPKFLDKKKNEPLTISDNE